MATPTLTQTIRTIKVGAIALIICVVLHYFALGLLALEHRINAGIEEAKASTIERLATEAGFERPQDERPILSAMEIAEREALRRNINPAVIRALLRHESQEDQFALSQKGAIGLMQVMPFNAKRCGLKVAELIDVEKNIMCGTKIFSEDLKSQRGKLAEALQSYNGGPGCVWRCKESINHSEKVLALLARDIRG